MRGVLIAFSLFVLFHWFYLPPVDGFIVAAALGAFLYAVLAPRLSRALRW